MMHISVSDNGTTRNIEIKILKHTTNIMKKIAINPNRFLTYSKRGLFSLISLLYLVSDLYGQNYASPGFSNNYQYKIFKNIFLPIESNIINTIFQDNMGLIWLGTKRGLFTYNGYKLDKLSINKDIEYANVSAIIQINEKYLCIGTEDGIHFFNLYTEQFDVPYPIIQSIKSVRSLLLWDDKLWIGTNNEGLIYYKLGDKEINLMPLESGRNDIVYSLEAAEGKLYIGSYDGLSYYDPTKNIRKTIQIPNPKQDLMVNSLLWDRQNDCLWIGTEEKLYQYSIKRSFMQPISSLPYNSFKTLVTDNKGNLIAGTDNGLYIINITSGETEHVLHDSRNSQSLCNNIIWSSYVDKNNNIWLGTDYGVSLMLNNSTYQLIHLSEITGKGDGNEFTCLYMDSSDKYWYGGVNGLLLFENNKYRWFNTQSQQNHLMHNRIRSIYEDRDHIVWIATDGGVARYDNKQEKFIYYTIIDKTKEKKANWAYDIYEDEDANLWIATYLGGLFVVNKHHLLSHNDQIPYIADWNSCSSNDTTRLSSIIYQIQSDKYGNIWANSQDGLVKIDPKTRRFSRIHANNFYIDKMIYDGVQYLWYSSNNDLYRIDTSNNKIEKMDELSAGSKIHCFVLENDNIWLSSTEGLSIWNLKSLSKLDIPITDRSFQSGFYDRRYNTVIWGGYDCIAYLPVRILSKKINILPIIITSVWANGRKLLPNIDYEGNSVRTQSNIHLPYSNRNLTFEFSTLTYSLDPDKGIYYSLGDEKVWNKLDAGQNSISFAKLNHGKYKLLIRNGSFDDPELSPVTCLDFTILPPWYLSSLAYIIYTILLFVIILSVIMYVRRRIRQKYLRKEKQKTLELSNLKMNFFIHISHELKTPLSLIIAPLSTLIAETSKSESKKKLELIYENSLKLNTLIHKVLDFKEINPEEENILIRSNVELNSFIGNLLGSFSSTFNAKNIQATLTSSEDQIWMNLDMIKIESVFSNVLTNATKYIPKSGGKIDISLVRTDNKVVIQISDTGSGIRKEDLPFVFIRYFQSKNKSIRKSGSGIGLYIVKKFIELHEGQVEIKSDGEDCGTIVTITLPLSGENTISSTQLFEAERQSDMCFGKPTLLIIDDNQDISNFLLKTFTDEYRCLCASNGKDGLTLVSEQHPDIIIVDQMMPEMDGIEFSKKLKKKPQTSTIPIVMLTARDDKDTEIKSIKAGVDAFMSKPFDVDKLNQRLKQLLRVRLAIIKKLKIEGIGQTIPVEKTQPDVDEVFMEQLSSVIEANIENTEFNVSMLCKLLNMENKKLCRKIKLLTGVTPVELIRRVRMRKAAMLLSQKRFSVSEVMYMVGYSNPSYFSKCFLAEYKVLPSQYFG